MLTFPLVSASLQKVTALLVVDGHVALSVEVIGLGTAKADQGQRGEGTGLDLPIVRTIAEAHRGTVTFTSTASGKHAIAKT